MTAPAAAGEHGTASPIEILPVTGLPEFRPGDDLTAALAAAAPWLRDGDVLVVTSKVLSKCEGRLVPAPKDPEARDALRRKLVDAESVRVLARKGRTLITENGLGVVQAASGVDGSNIGTDELALLPVDPDGSAVLLRAGLRKRLGVTVGVVITDTMGRAWRNGQTDAAVGAAGIAVLHGYAGAVDRHGNELLVTEVAIADEIAAAADLIKQKTTGVPVAIVRGLPDLVTDAAGPGAAAIIRPAEDDMFRLGAADVVTARRTIRDFTQAPVSSAAVRRAIAAAITAPAPHHSTPWRFAVLESADTRTRLLDDMLAAWTADLTADGFTAGQIARRVRRGDPLRNAPLIIVPCLAADAAHTYPDASRNASEHAMFVVAMGAAIENLLVALAVEGLGSCWISSTLFCRDVTVQSLGLPADWEPMGAIGVGHPAAAAPDRPARDPASFILPL